MKQRFDNEDNELQKYGKDFSDSSLSAKLLKYGKLLGAHTLYQLLQLWFVLKKPNLPLKVKSTIMGALGYYIVPLDLIPDFTPAAGYTDDIAVLAYALVVAEIYIDDEIRKRAKEQVAKIFDEATAAKL